MKKIALTHGFVALIDAEDFELVSGHRWCASKGRTTFYALTTIRMPDGRRTNLKMHRLIMQPPAEMQIDHVDRDGLNNQRDNLRLATPSENKRNCSTYSNSMSGFKGVCFCKDCHAWQARIVADNKRISLGLYATAEAAHAAYCAASIRYHGAFGRVA